MASLMQGVPLHPLMVRRCIARRLIRCSQSPVVCRKVELQRHPTLPLRTETQNVFFLFRIRPRGTTSRPITFLATEEAQSCVFWGEMFKCCRRAQVQKCIRRVSTAEVATSFYPLNPTIPSPSRSDHNAINTDLAPLSSTPNFSELAELCDVLTVEIEHVNCEFLSSLEARGVRVQPSPKTISVVQDKYAQKEHFEKVCVFDATPVALVE